MTAPPDRIWAWVWDLPYPSKYQGKTEWSAAVIPAEQDTQEYILRNGPTMQAAIAAALTEAHEEIRHLRSCLSQAEKEIAAAEARGLRMAAELLDTAARDCDHAVIGDTAYHNRNWVEMRRDSYRYAAGKVRALIPASPPADGGDT